MRVSSGAEHMGGVLGGDRSVTGWFVRVAYEPKGIKAIIVLQQQ